MRLDSGETGVVEQCLDGGERLWIRIPSITDWPFPRWVHIVSEKVTRISTPQSPDSKPPVEEPPVEETPVEEPPF